MACVFFGTFNPVHTGHLVMAQSVLNQFPEIGEIRFIPAASPPHRADEADMAPARHRLKMVRLATASNPGFKVSDIESRRAGPSYTADTLFELREIYGWSARIPMIIGSDALAKLPTWHQPREIIEQVRFLQAPRPETPFVTELVLDGMPWPLASERIEMPTLAISASDIRRRASDPVTSAEGLRYLVSEPVRQYITSNRLYR